MKKDTLRAVVTMLLRTVWPWPRKDAMTDDNTTEEESRSEDSPYRVRNWHGRWGVERIADGWGFCGERKKDARNLCDELNRLARERDADGESCDILITASKKVLDNWDAAREEAEAMKSRLKWAEAAVAKLEADIAAGSERAKHANGSEIPNGSAVASEEPGVAEGSKPPKGRYWFEETCCGGTLHGPDGVVATSTRHGNDQGFRIEEELNHLHELLLAAEKRAEECKRERHGFSVANEHLNKTNRELRERLLQAEDTLEITVEERDAARDELAKLQLENEAQDANGSGTANGSGGDGEELYPVEETGGRWYVRMAPDMWLMAGTEFSAYAFSKTLKEFEAARLAADVRAQVAESNLKVQTDRANALERDLHDERIFSDERKAAPAEGGTLLAKVAEVAKFGSQMNEVSRADMHEVERLRSELQDAEETLAQVARLVSERARRDAEGGEADGR